jgi:hypothetical protein
MTSTPIRALAAALLTATTAAASPAPSERPPQSGDVVVVGGPRPKVVASFPADGAEAPAGVLVLKIVFDQHMTADGWSYGQSEQGAFPRCLAHPRLLGDERTVVLLCAVAPRRTYALEINAAPDFVNAHGRSAKPTRLHFSTTDTVVRNLHDALTQAGLTDADEPIMTWRDPGAGVSQSPPPEDAGSSP